MFLWRNNITVFACFWVLACAAFVRADDPASEEFFEKRIRPVLAGTCFRCHGGGQKVGGQLRVDSREALLKGGETAPAIDEGAPENSLLLKAIRREDDVSAMPPDKPLKEQEIADLTAWIKAGAPWPKAAKKFEAAPHWAFQPLIKTKSPAVKEQAWPRTSIDPFILAPLEAAGRKPSVEADRRTWLRRVTYDLTGLPPTAEEVAAFEKDPSPQAYEAVVDRLLASKAYGEQWGRHWLDVVRYADTAGENSDHPLPHAWKYRNWVIDAFNRDLSYDEFLREQIAGDLLAQQGPPELAEQRIIATGYLAIARRFGHEIDKEMHLTLEDTLDTLGKSTLGLSLGCCRCHDHKFDPLSVEDYYGLYGIFESTKFPFPGCEPQQQPRDLVSLPLSPEMQRKVSEIDQRLAELAKTPANGEEQSQLEKRRQELVAAKPVASLAYAVREGDPHHARIHERGEPAQLGNEVPRKFLDALGGYKLANVPGSGRLQLAQWLTDPKNPLTARVIVNRVWQWHFGHGLVATPNDFGTRGTPPTHPELLDHLAGQFVSSGWKFKDLHRQIVLSATYRQAAGDSAATNLYGAFHRRRLTAEEIRDTLLVAGGDLDAALGGPHPFPPEASWNFTQHAPFAADYDTNKRSVYVMQKRNRRHRFFALFDGADPNTSSAVRDVTTVPTQALFFLNDPLVHAQAEKFSDRVVASALEDKGRLEFAYRQLLGRSPTTEEQASFTEFQTTYAAAVSDRPEAERPTLTWQAYARVLLSSNEVLHVD